MMLEIIGVKGFKFLFKYQSYFVTRIVCYMVE
jgi:hypothetical protein